MKVRISFLVLFVAAAVLGSAANRAVSATSDIPVGVSDVNVRVDGSSVIVSMKIDRSWSDRNREVIVQPAIVSTDKSDTLCLPQVVIAGKNRYYRHERREDMNLSELYRAGKDEPVEYQQTVAMQPWMAQSTVVINRSVAGCCGNNEAAVATPIAMIDMRQPTFAAKFIYTPPTATAVKEREIDGKAFIDYVVNTITLNPEYRRNPEELAKIIASIDTVREDPDCIITGLWFKGYASPEGSYEHNTYLAKGRTTTLSNYVKTLYHYPDSIVHMEFEPENWEDLREYVDASNLEHRAEILELIDDKDLDIDVKNLRIQARYPEEYTLLLRTVYPGLRTCKYRITYTIRNYLDPAEILRVMHTSPQNLSLNEFYIAANSLPQGSAEYNEVFETAVRMYPDDEVANLNAANSAMMTGDFTRAAAYLDRAGEGANVQYARGMLAAIQGDYQAARQAFEQARTAGLTAAEDALASLDAIDSHTNVTFLVEE